MFSTEQASHVGLTTRETVVAIEYAHLRQTADATRPIWAGTYNPETQTINTLADVQTHDEK